MEILKDAFFYSEKSTTFLPWTIKKTHISYFSPSPLIAQIWSYLLLFKLKLVLTQVFIIKLSNTVLLLFPVFILMAVPSPYISIVKRICSLQDGGTAWAILF